MTKAQKLKLVNWSLLVAMTLTLGTAIILEATDSRSVLLVWIHIGIALAAMLLGVEHVRLHYGWKKWFEKFAKQKKQALRILWWLFLLVAASALAATIHWIASGGVHHAIGGIHGKIGFLMLAFAIGHVAKRINYFKR